MRVLHVTPDLSIKGGGLATVTNDLCLALARDGHNVAILTQTDEAPSSADIAHLCLRVSWTAAPFQIRDAEQKLARHRAEVVHIHGLWSPLSCVVATAARRSNVPYVVAPHGMLDPWALSQSGWKKRIALASFEKRNLSFAALLHALNAAEAAAIRGLGFDGPLEVVSNGVWPVEVRHEFTSEPDRATLLFLGRVTAKKGLIVLLHAWAIAVTRAPAFRAHWRLEIAGWGDTVHIAELKALASSLGVESDVVFAGEVRGERKAELFRKAAAFILPSYSEGQPMAALESLAYGVPALISANCNMPELIDADGALPITLDPETLAVELLCYLQDASLLAGVGAAGRDLARTRYGWAAIARRWTGLYERLVE